MSAVTLTLAISSFRPNADIVVRNADAALDILKGSKGSISELIIDHELGSESRSGLEILAAMYHQKILPDKITLTNTDIGSGTIVCDRYRPNSSHFREIGLFLEVLGFTSTLRGKTYKRKPNTTEVVSS